MNSSEEEFRIKLRGLPFEQALKNIYYSSVVPCFCQSGRSLCLAHLGNCPVIIRLFLIHVLFVTVLNIKRDKLFAWGKFSFSLRAKAFTV